MTAGRQVLPLQKTRKILKRIGEEDEKYQQTRLHVLLTWIEAGQELEGASEETVPAMREKVNLVGERYA